MRHPTARTGYRLYAEMRSAPPLRGKVANRAATAPWLEDVHEELSRVLGANATRNRPVPRPRGERNGRPAWRQRWMQDAAYSGHWLGNIRAKLAKPTAAGASLAPAEYVGKVVHKAAEDFGVHSDDTVHSALGGGGELQHRRPKAEGAVL
jgi:hypothetical protein